MQQVPKRGTGPVSFEAPMMCKFCETDISLGLAVCPSCGKLQSTPGQTTGTLCGLF